MHKIVKIVLLIKKKRILKSLGLVGTNVKIPSNLIISGGNNIYLQDNVNIGTGAVLFATNAKIIIKKWFISSHNLKIITGDHERRIGKFCASITEKDKDYNKNLDQDVIINEDVWCGMNVIILKGVTIGRGCTICAGAVVAKSSPPYSIIGGVPARFIKFYWTINEILEHESKLYNEEDRYSKEELESIFKKYNY